DKYYPLRVRPGQRESGVTALATDAAGRVYACTPLGIQVFDPTARLCGVLQKPGPGELSAITFSGADRDMLVVACGEKLYVRKMLAKVLPLEPNPRCLRLCDTAQSRKRGLSLHHHRH